MMAFSTRANDLLTIRIGVAAGFVACTAYALMVAAPLPPRATAALAGAFGPALALASYGLRRTLEWETPSVAASSAGLLNAVAAGLVTAMLLVQLAVRQATAPGKPPLDIVAVWLGLDVAWDVFIGLGTVGFGIALARRPRVAALLGWLGMALGGGLIVLNFWTFPTPPANASLFDLGPFVGAWYLAATVWMWSRARRLVRQPYAMCAGF